MAQNQTQIDIYKYKLRSSQLRRKYAKRLSWKTLVETEFGIGDGAVMQAHKIGQAEIYVLFYNGRVVAMYDDAAVAWEVSRVVHEVLRLARLEHRRRRKRS